MNTPKLFVLVGIAAITLSAGAQTRLDMALTVSPQSGAAGMTSKPPLMLTLQDALQRAKANSPDFRSAVTELGLAHGDKVQARAALLPNVNFATQYIYTEGHGAGPGLGKFIANNGVHEYVAQGTVVQDVSGALLADYRRTAALEAVAHAKLEIATRGLVVTLVRAYYGYVVAQRKYATVQQAAIEAQNFFNITQKLEKGGEVAHSDVIKAQIQYNAQQRDLQEAQLDMNRTRLELAVLLFPDFNENFAVVDDLRLPAPLPSFEEVQAAASKNNPELRAALASVRAAGHEVSAAWGGVLPSLSLEYFYGIDAPQFATYGPYDPSLGARIKNLGYSAAATLNVPVWNWGANWSKVKQAKLQREQANLELSFAQRQLLANLRSFYQELQTSRAELESLAQSADLAAESLHLTSLRYQAGEATVLEVVDAQNTLTQARNAYDDGQVRFRTAQATLQTLTGTM
jgi:outer membrane protein TolC